MTKAPHPFLLDMLGKPPKPKETTVNMHISEDANGYVRIDFGTPVEWMALPKDQALDFAHAILAIVRRVSNQ